MKDLSYLSEHRIDLFGDGLLGDEYNGAFKITIKGEDYKIIASNGCEWEHVSISPFKSHKIPSWSVMCILKAMFFEEEEVVMQLHPKKSEYVNNMKTCLHLWRPTVETIPTPPSILVGLK